MMKVCKWQPYSTNTVTIIYINTTFRNIVFIAYQTSANKASHFHCFWNLSENHTMLYNIVSFQSSPDIQNCIYQFCTHSVVQFQFYNVCLVEYLFHFCITVSVATGVSLVNISLSPSSTSDNIRLLCCSFS